MSCTFIQSTSNGNMNVHDDLKLNVFYCQTILESFSLIDMFVYFPIEIRFVVDYQTRIKDAFMLGENKQNLKLIKIGTFFIYSVQMCSLFDMNFMQTIMYCHPMKCFRKPCFQMGVFKSIPLFSHKVYLTAWLPTFCMLYLYICTFCCYILCFLERIKN